MWSCGGPYKKFWASGWNRFDFIVVAVGVLLMTGIVPPGSPLGNLKMMRAFRVFRLFKRIKSLNKVVMALIKAIPGVSNAFVIMVRRSHCSVALQGRAVPAPVHLAPTSCAHSAHCAAYAIAAPSHLLCPSTCSASYSFRAALALAQVIFMMIYAILAVEYFAPLGQEFDPELWPPYGTYVTWGDAVNGTQVGGLVDMGREAVETWRGEAAGRC